MWKQKLQDVKKYIDKHQKSPSHEDKDKTIQSLGSWFGNQKRNYDNDILKSKYIMKNEEIHILWTEFIQDVKYQEYLLNNDEMWKQKLQDVKDYIDKNQKLPLQEDKDKDKDKTIQSLGIWLITQKKNYDNDISKSKYIMKNKEIHILWTNFLQDVKYQEYFLNNDEIWKQKLQDVKDYIDKNQKLPSREDKNKTIKSLGSWLINQKTNYDNDISKSKQIMKNESIHILWTEFIQDVKYKEYLLNNDDIWKQKLQDVKKYIDTNKKTPSKQDKNKTIKSLGNWFSNQKKNYDKDISKSKQIMKKDEIHILWTEFLQDVKYKEYLLNNDEMWKQKLQDVKKYIDKHQKSPSQEDKDKTIKSLGSWLVTQKTNYDNDISKCNEIMKNESIHILWTEFLQDIKYKEYLLNNDEIWKQKLQDVKKYIDKNKKTPSKQDKNKTIQSLGNWFSNQKKNYDNNISKCNEIMKNKEIHISWTEFTQDNKYNKYFLNNDEMWKQKLQDVKDYIDKNQKLPPHEDKNKNIQSLRIWFRRQKKNYDNDISKSKYIMKNEEIHILWTEFIQNVKYQKY